MYQSDLCARQSWYNWMQGNAHRDSELPRVLEIGISAFLAGLECAIVLRPVRQECDFGRLLEADLVRPLSSLLANLQRRRLQPVALALPIMPASESTQQQHPDQSVRRATQLSNESSIAFIFFSAKHKISYFLCFPLTVAHLTVNSHFRLFFGKK